MIVRLDRMNASYEFGNGSLQNGKGDTGRMDSALKRRYHWLMTIITVAVMVCGIAQMMNIQAFNGQEHTAVGNATSEPTYLDLHPRGDATSSWIKRERDLQGIVLDGILYNHANDEVSDWTLTIRIQGECYLNQFWNGTVTVHQHVKSGTEKEQTLSLAAYDPNDLLLDYEIDDTDLLIPLSEGDYIVYHPAEKHDELRIRPKDELVVGTIFYYEKNLDLSDYQLNYHYYRPFTSGWMFILLCVLVVLLGVTFAVYLSARYVYAQAKKEMELKKSGMSSMADYLYKAIYIIDLPRNEMIPVKVDEASDQERLRAQGAAAQMDQFFAGDAKPDQREMMRAFGSLSTLAARLKIRNHIIMEYESVRCGWCRVLFIAMEKKPDGEIVKAIFAIQEINQEKEEMADIIGKYKKAEMESQEKTSFLTKVSYEIRSPINEMLGLNEKLRAKNTDPGVETLAAGIQDTGRMLLAMVDDILERSKMESGTLTLVNRAYSLKGLLNNVLDTIRPRFSGSGLTFTLKVTPTIPDGLYGDELHIRQVILNLLTAALKYTRKGGITLSVFGKRLEGDREYLLISVEDTGNGMTRDELKAVSETLRKGDDQKSFDPESRKLGLDLAAAILQKMNATLKCTSVHQEGTYMYFEIEQGILSGEPVGQLETQGLGSREGRG